METPTADSEIQLYSFRLYATSGGEITTFTTSVDKWEVGEVFTISDGRRFEIRRVTIVAGGEIDGMFDVDQVE